MIRHRFFQSICEMAAANQIITPVHMGLITALLYFADGKQPLSYFHSSRKKLMRLSRIKSFATYHRCMADLTQQGFIEYIPSWHPKQASRFRFTRIKKEDTHG